MARTFKTEGIVLRKRNLLNKDLIITLFTEKYGKINVIAAGIKKITSRRLPHTQTGNLIKAVIYRKEERFYLQETQLISAFSQIKNNNEKINKLYRIFFVIERLAPEAQKETILYNLMKKFLIELSGPIGHNTSTVERYLNRILMLLGYLHKEKSADELPRFIEEIIHEKIPSFNI
jgi:DNA repair protein RecO (recombination protein O)